MTRHLLNKFLLWAFALLTLPAAGQTNWIDEAETDWYDNNKDATEFTISTPEQLAGLAKLVNNRIEYFSGKIIYLDKDIQLNDTDGWESWETSAPAYTWTPIGGGTDDKLFKGTFDGQNHTISGIYIRNSFNYQGLFGYVNGGTIKNLSVTDSYIKVGDLVGGIVGRNNNGTVSNCSNSGTVTGTIAGAFVGGIVGWNDKGTVSSCSNSGTVTGESDNAYVGGIVGWNSNGTVSSCSNSGTVTVIGTVAGVYVGGIVGYSKGTVSNCSNSGTVTGGGAGVSVGGIVGHSYSGTVSNCYYLGQDGLQGVGNDEDNAGTISKNTEEYESGEVARLLDETGEIWGQDFDKGYPVPLGSLSKEEREAYKIYSVTLSYEGATETLYGNSDTPITPPTAPEGYIYTWEPALPATFGDLTDVTTFTATLVEEPDPEEPTEPTEPEEPDVPHITYYDVRFVQPNDSVNFDYRSDQVREGNTFSFSASAAEGYDPRTLVVEYRRGPVGIWREATLDTDGKYHIRANYADLYIRARVEPLNPTGVEAIGDEAVKVYTDNGAICVYTPSEERVIIVSMSGAVVRMDEQVGTRRYDLPKGIYIVRVGDEVFKVSN